VIRVAVLAAVLGAVACAPRPKATPVLGPDGTRMVHLSCPGDEASCLRLAGEHCPRGYEIGPGLGERGSYLVRCRATAGATGWAPTVDLAPSPYGAPPAGARPYVTPHPVTTTPRGYPPLGGGSPSQPSDVGY
jgi:hypothetical protein